MAASLTDPRQHLELDNPDIPLTARAAYLRAAATMAKAAPACGIESSLLAAIGWIESDHGRYGGARLDVDGVSTPLIRGVALDGKGPVSHIADTDGGSLDGDKRWDRAVGPMQFIPTTWVSVAVDADGDGLRSPDDIDDAALAAAVYLCSAPGTLDTAEGRQAAVLRYNASMAYADAVLRVEHFYRDSETAWSAPSPALEALEIVVPVQRSGLAPQTPARTAKATGDVRDKKNSPGGSPTPSGAKTAPTSDGKKGEDRHDGSGGTKEPGWKPAQNNPESTPTPETTPKTEPTPATTPTPETTPAGTPNPPETGVTPTPEGTPKGTPEASPTPTPPYSPICPTASGPVPTPASLTAVAVLSDLTGTLHPCENGWYLDETLLDVGDTQWLAGPALSDLDGDGVLETNSSELTGLAGEEVTLKVADQAVVVRVNDLEYRPAS